MTYISKSSYKKYFSGWVVTSCVVKSNQLISLCLRKEISSKKASSLSDDEIPTRLLTIQIDKTVLLSNQEENSEHIEQIEVDSLYKPKIAISIFPQEHLLMVSTFFDLNGTVLLKGDNDWLVEAIDEGHLPGVINIKCVNGYAYAVGSDRSVYKREDLNKWIKLENGLPEISIDKSEADKFDNFDDYFDSLDIEEKNFNDIDGFNEKDIYVVGSEGDLWYYDGTIWNQCGFPSNEELTTVVCAPDGQVYIGGEGGNLWAGREHSWRCIYQGTSSVEWNEMRWFQEQLWLCSDYELKIWDGKQMVNPVHNGEEIELRGHMDARDGVLLVVDTNSAVLFDGTDWHSIV
ncbi:hypothetical protein [Serratia microhaemolytica]|uniref:hypothetical protein n=1 Tax=Serratia microhaemolytica TaxID=2675110 RepID=UPI000FDDB76A|nr:hypothetical protein [Serratia microhaemolytica]